MIRRRTITLNERLDNRRARGGSETVKEVRITSEVSFRVRRVCRVRKRSKEIRSVQSFFDQSVAFSKRELSLKSKATFQRIRSKAYDATKRGARMAIRSLINCNDTRACVETLCTDFHNCTKRTETSNYKRKYGITRRLTIRLTNFHELVAKRE